MKNIFYIIAFMDLFFVPHVQVHVLDASFENLTSCNPVGRYTLFTAHNKYSTSEKPDGCHNFISILSRKKYDVHPGSVMNADNILKLFKVKRL